jgi:hypothetical protein
MWDLDMHTIYMASLFVEGVLYGEISLLPGDQANDMLF